MAVGSLQGRGQRIIVVEDEPQVLWLTARILREAGYQVVEAATPTEALDACHSDASLELLLTDLVMPEMAGTELVGRVATVRPGLPAIMMSGYAHDVLALGDDTARSLPVIQKPFSEETLLAAVHTALNAEISL